MSSLDDGFITKGYRYVNFTLTVLYLVVFAIVITQSTIVFFFCFRLSSLQIGVLLSITSCGKLMHVFSTDIGLLFFLDHSPSTIINRRIIQSNKIIPLDLKGGSGIQGG